MSLRIRRGTDAQRGSVIFDLGEPVWTTNFEQLWVGDGVTRGGISIAQGIAGPGLAYNATTGKLETSNATLTTDDIIEGSTHKYFANSLAVTAVAAAFASGTQTGITISYNNGSLNAIVPGHGTLTENLQLNSYSITGTGSININGNITSNAYYGDLFNATDNVTPITMIAPGGIIQDTSRLSITSCSNSLNSDFSSSTGLRLSTARNTIASPTATTALDYLGYIGFETYIDSVHDYELVSLIQSRVSWNTSGLFANPTEIDFSVRGLDGSVITTSILHNGMIVSPALQTKGLSTTNKNAIVSSISPTNTNSDLYGTIVYDTTLQRLQAFDSTGWNNVLLANHPLQTVVYASSAARDSALPTPSIGMIIFNTQTGKFEGNTNGTTGGWAALN